MNATMERGKGDVHVETGERRRTSRAAGGFSIIETIDCAGVIVLAILGLTGVLTADFMAIAIIAFGASLLFQGGTVGARYSRSRTSIGEQDSNYGHVRGGMAMEFLAGASGVVLGILTLAGLAQAVLPAVAVIAFGGALLLGSVATSRLRGLEYDHGYASGIATAAAGLEVLAGLAAIVLGILALVGLSPTVLTLVALLSISTAILLECLAMSQRWLHWTA